VTIWILNFHFEEKKKISHFYQEQLFSSDAKGQLISKRLFGVFNSPKKRTETIRLFSFVFWERHLEMN
jgi:hypothetical protein